MSNHDTSPAPITNGTPSTTNLPPAALDLAACLFDLARSGDTAVLSQYITAGIPPNLTNYAGDTLLMLAAYHNRVETVSALLTHGADANALNDKGQSPVAGAVFKGYIDVVRVLIEQGGADIRAGKPNAIECAAMFNRWDCAQLMNVEEECRELAPTLNPVSGGHN